MSYAVNGRRLNAGFTFLVRIHVNNLAGGLPPQQAKTAPVGDPGGSGMAGPHYSFEYMSITWPAELAKASKSNSGMMKSSCLVAKLSLEATTENSMTEN